MSGRTDGGIIGGRVAAGVVISVVTLAATVTVGSALRAQSQRAAGAPAEARIAALEATVKSYQSRLQRLEDIESINKLQRAYGYYIDEGQWTQVADLFADTSSVEIAARGVYL